MCPSASDLMVQQAQQAAQMVQQLGQGPANQAANAPAHLVAPMFDGLGMGGGGSSSSSSSSASSASSSFGAPQPLPQTTFSSFRNQQSGGLGGYQSNANPFAQHAPPTTLGQQQQPPSSLNPNQPLNAQMPNCALPLMDGATGTTATAATTRRPGQNFDILSLPPGEDDDEEDGEDDDDGHVTPISLASSPSPKPKGKPSDICRTQKTQNTPGKPKSKAAPKPKPTPKSKAKAKAKAKATPTAKAKKKVMKKE